MDENSIFHLGSLDWMPNQEAVKWFLENVWMKVLKQHPDLMFYVAGRNMPDEFKKINYPNVNFISKVDNAIHFMNSKNLMVVPLFAGSGMRIKIIEGMALGKTIISTSIGAEGIDAIPDIHILIANTPSEFVNQINKCLAEPDFSKKIGDSAMQFVHNKYDNTLVINDLIIFYKQLIKKG